MAQVDGRAHSKQGQQEDPMRTVLVLALALSGAAMPALAIEHNVVRWKKTGQCEIVTTLPRWGDHWTVLGEYDSRAEAERALAKSRQTRACPVSKTARRADTLPDEERATVLYRSPDDRDRDRRRRQDGTVLRHNRQP
jgi:hypothetical protein